jgi:hypothetical protein
MKNLKTLTLKMATAIVTETFANQHFRRHIPESRSHSGSENLRTRAAMSSATIFVVLLILLGCTARSGLQPL